MRRFLSLTPVTAFVSRRQLLPAVVIAQHRGYSTQEPIIVNVTDQEGKLHALKGKEDQSVMELCRDNKLDMEAACDGTCACSTCHVYVDKEWFKKLPPATDDEMDMLDLAWGLEEDSSRLACQIQLKREVSGLCVSLPKQTVNQLD
eukprot:PhM_4_TR13145/c0_g2_i1/m.58387/K22071/FDX2; ferredoxin-2, mitochondrial